MIQLFYSNGGVFVYSASDWATLRKEYRIIGEIVGNTNFIPALPSKLLPEEVLFLVDKGVVEVVQRKTPSAPDKARYEKFEKDMLQQQQTLYKTARKRQLESMIDNIVEAKRKRGDNRSSDEILNEELDKSCTVTEDNLIWPTFLTPFTSSSDYEKIPRDEILKCTSQLKCRVFKDLWEKGYYITSGHKFGGNFLAYKGDPILFHAIFIVHCIEDPNKAMHPSEIVAFGRLGTIVKKRAVMASIDEEDKVNYLTLNWIEASDKS